MRQVNASHHTLKAASMARIDRGTLTKRYPIAFQPVPSRSADWSQPKNPGRAVNGAGSPMVSCRSPWVSARWMPPTPLAPLTPRAMITSPRNVTSKTIPDAIVSRTNARPNAATADPVIRKVSSDHVRFVKGVRRTVRRVSRARFSRSSEMTISIYQT